jgi:hypothetical protein
MDAPARVQSMTSLATSAGVKGLMDGGLTSLPTGASATMIFLGLSFATWISFSMDLIKKHCLNRNVKNEISGKMFRLQYTALSTLSPLNRQCWKIQPKIYCSIVAAYCIDL